MIFRRINNLLGVALILSSSLLVDGMVVGRVVQEADATVSGAVGMEAVRVDGNVELEAFLADGSLEDGGGFSLADDGEEFLDVLVVVGGKVETALGKSSGGLADGWMRDKGVDEQ